MSGTVNTPQGSKGDANVAEEAGEQPPQSQEPRVLSPIPDDQLQQLIADAKAENRRLQMAHELAELQAKNTALRNSNSPTTVVGPTSLWGGLLPAAEVIPKVKTLRPEKIRLYKGLSEGEHLRWFRDVDIKFLVSPEYFTTDQAKIGFCMTSLKDDPNT